MPFPFFFCNIKGHLFVSLPELYPDHFWQWPPVNRFLCNRKCDLHWPLCTACGRYPVWSMFMIAWRDRPLKHVSLASHPLRPLRGRPHHHNWKMFSAVFSSRFYTVNVVWTWWRSPSQSPSSHPLLFPWTPARSLLRRWWQRYKSTPGFLHFRGWPQNKREPEH